MANIIIDMDNKKFDYREILTRQPFFEVMPQGGYANRIVKRGQNVSEPNEEPYLRVITQADFLRQYYPTGHKIMDKIAYPDIYKKDPDTDKWYMQPITRVAFAFQRTIATKQVVHICGNDIQFELSGKAKNEKDEIENALSLIKLKQGWLDMNMEFHFYEAINSIKIVGDAAIVAYKDKKGNARCKTLSYLYGDTLYPHEDSITGDMELFARKYKDYDEDGHTITEWVEIWDSKYMYRAKRGLSKNTTFQRIKETFGLGGFEIVSQEEHGFDTCPVAYYREKDGACWLPSQSTIENYEEAFSYLCEDNKAHAFPIMYFKGEGVDFKGDEVTGAVKAIEIEDNQGEVGFLNRPDVSESFNAELNKLYDMIYEQCFCVKPPELKSGDLPGVAVKLLFSPAIELAIHDCNKLQSFLDKLVYLVKFSYGSQINEQLTLLNLNVNAWIEPYIHQNDTELVTNVAMAVQNSFLSKQTASERISKYAKNDEFERIMREDIEKRKKDTQDFIDKQKEQLENELKKQKILNEMTDGSDINNARGTGKHKGRPNKTGKTWDDNGNEPNENNWDKVNKNLL